MEIFLFWICLAVVIGVAASHRGRSGVGWCLLSLLISPILTGILLFVLPRRDVLTNIATLAMIEATPEGSRSRQLLAEHQAKLAQKGSAAWLVGSSSNRPWSSTSSSKTMFKVAVAVLLMTMLVLFGVIAEQSKSSPKALAQQTKKEVPPPTTMPVPPPTTMPVPEKRTTPGPCQNPDDRAANGSRCGGRASSERLGGR